MAAEWGFSISETRDSLSTVNKKNSELTKKSVKIFHPNAEYAVSCIRFTLRIIGLWPDKECEKSHTNMIKEYIPPILTISVIGFITIPQIFASIIYNFVLDERIQLIIDIFGFIGVLARIVALWFNGEARCLSFLNEDWDRKLLPRERETMMKNAKLGRNIAIGVTILVQCLVWSYVFLKTWSLFYLKLDVENATDLGKQLFCPGYCPFDLRNPLNFVFVWSGQCISLICSAFAYSGADGFVAVLIIHLCGQMTILRYELIHVIDDNTCLRYESFRVKLAVIIKRHHRIIELSLLIKNSINLMLLVVTLVYTIQFGLQLFRLLIAVIEREPGKFPYLEVFFYFSFLNVMFVTLFIYCYIGDMLIQESEALGFASYSCKWYNLSGKKAKDLEFVMCRARAPLQIWAGKFVPFSLQLFSKVLKTSMGYFSLLVTVKKRSVE